MADIKRNLYNISLATQGYLLIGLPKGTARKVNQAPIYGSRFASGDRDYLDFTFWWYWAQTDWSYGFKNTISWLDDAKYYYSTNIDTFSEYGAMKLIKGLILDNTFDASISCGSYETIAGDSFPYIGTGAGLDGKPRLFRYTAGSWTNIISLWIPNTASWISDAISHKNKLFILSVGSVSASTYAVTKADADGTNQIDYTGAIATAMGWTAVTGAHSLTGDENILYVAVQQYGSDKFGIVKTTDSGANWTKVVEYLDAGDIPCMLLIGTNLYYLIERKYNPVLELRRYNLTDSTDILITKFFTTLSTFDQVGFSASRRLLHYLNGNLIITIPVYDIWEFDLYTGKLKQLLKKNSPKIKIGQEANYDTGADLNLRGGIIHENKIWWANLMYDGKYFFNTKKDADESTTEWLRPIFTDGNLIYWNSGTDFTKLYKDSGYKGTTGKNFLVFNQIDPISTIKKLFYSIVVLFNKLVSGQKIILEYSFDEMTTWTELGNVDFSVDGGTITSKTFFFPENTIDAKLWLRVKLEGGGADTPTLKDISMAYLPLPDYKQKWVLNLQCYDNMILLDGKTKETKRGEELKNILKTYWWKKEVLDFQDVDYAETLLNGALTASATTITVDSTNQFPEQGRLKIEKEEITYTGKTATTFTGCVREARGTVATSHADDILVSSGYKIIITNFAESIPIGIKPKIGEYIVALELREV